MYEHYNTLFIGKVFINLKSIDSTNLFALQLLKEKAVIEGTVIRAEQQYAGRGQRDNSWLSEANKNLTLSIILTPKWLPINQQFYLTMVAALGVRHCLAAICGTKKIVQIKWPNDILINGKKIAGILIENNVLGKQISSSVVGIGINVNQTKFDTALPFASSLRVVTQQKLSLDKVANLLYHHIEALYLQLRNRQFNSIKQQYWVHLMGKNTFLRYKQRKSNDIIYAKIIDVLEDGRILMDCKSTFYQQKIQQCQFYFKEIEWLR